tara:strand:- start:211 stop:777 length:567 start_codon:yes stop_codon:yes gene_type:complete
MPESKEVKLGFLKIIDVGEAIASPIYTGDDKSYRGALLITDAEAYPLELVYSDAVKPTAIERIALGVKLQSGINVKRIALPLMKKLKNKPSIIFVDDVNLLNAQKETQTIICSLSEDGDVDENSFFKDSTTYQKKVSSILEKSPNLDIQEPFSRLSEAIDYVHSESNSNSIEEFFDEESYEEEEVFND